ncbi:aldehyde dehydrogenase [Urechidicola sp. KH5]
MKQLVENQRNYFNSNITKDVKFRKEQLKNLRKAIKENEQILYEAIYNDFKKSKFDAFSSELALIYVDIKDALRNIDNWAKKKHKPTNMVNLPGKSYVLPEPLGVSLIIGAWNYPIYLALAPAVSAMVAGCTIILKPSEFPSNVSKAISNLVKNNFNPNYFTVVEGGISETTKLLDQKFDKIFFTGSTAVGRIVYQAAAKHLTPVTLELGGKSPTFVTESANLKMAAKRLVWAKFLNAGQTCIAPDYILVDESVQDNFINLLIEEIKNSNFDIDNKNYVQIINSKNVERLEKLIDKSKVVYGGYINKENRVIEPTVMRNISFDDAVMQEEIFGPILPIISFTNLKSEIARIKNEAKPLACYIFSGKRSEKQMVLEQLSYGGGCVNDAIMHISNHHLAYGGVGDSGLGAYHGEAGFKAFSHYKSILERPTWIEPNIKYYPHTATKLKLIRWIFGIK